MADKRCCEGERRTATCGWMEAAVSLGRPGLADPSTDSLCLVFSSDYCDGNSRSSLWHGDPLPNTLHTPEKQ